MSKTLKKALVLILSCICLVSFAAGCEVPDFINKILGKEPSTPAHTHTLEKVDAKLATCTEAGTQSYYKCNGCELIFADAEGAQEISAPVPIDPQGHSYADELTCHDRACTKGCGHVEKATTDHVYVDGICGCQAVEPLDEMKIHLISQPSLGDSYLIQVDGVNILVDGNNRTDGTHNVAETQVIPFLQSQGVDKIDYLLITHPHDDHIGGLVDISEAYDIDQVWYYPIDFTLAQEGDFETGKQYLEEFLAVCEEKEIPLNIPTTEGQELAISENFTIKMYNLDILENQKQNDNVNALGIIYLAEYYGKKVLFPGDTFSDGDEIISLPATAPSSTPVFEEIGDIDIMMAQHHGGTGCINTYPTFEALTPEYVFMSFPSPMDKSYTNGWYKLAVPTLTRCDLLQIPCYATGQSGDITITINELGEIDITSELEGDDLTPMKPPKQTSKVSSIASELTTDYYAIDVTFDRNMVGDEQAETITSTTACWYFDGELMTEDLGAYFAWNSEKAKTTLTFYVPIAEYDAEATEHEFVITIDFVSFNGICVNNDYSFKYNGTAWESQNIVTVTNVGDYGFNFNQTMKVIMFTFSAPVTNYTTATVVNGTTGILFNGVEIEGDYIQYCAPSGNTQMLLFLPKALWDRGSQGVVITITKEFETENGFKLIKDASYGYYESLGQWGLYTGDTFPETDPEVAEILEIANRGLTSADGKYYDIKIYFTMNHGHTGETFVFTEENNHGFTINGKTITSITNASGGLIWGITSYLVGDGDNYYTLYLAENQIDTENGLVFSIDKDTDLVEGGLKESVVLKWGENPSSILNPIFGFTKFDDYTGDFSEFTESQYDIIQDISGNATSAGGKYYEIFITVPYGRTNTNTSSSLLFTEEENYGIKINNKTITSVTKSGNLIWGVTTYMVPGDTFYRIYLAKNQIDDANGVVVTIAKDSPLFATGLKADVSMKLTTKASTLFNAAQVYEKYEGDFSEFTETQYEVIQDVSGNATSAGSKYYQVYITIPYGIARTVGETLLFTEENNAYGIKVNGQLVTSNSTTVVWGETVHMGVAATYYTLHITKTQIDDTNGVVITIEKDSPLLTTGLKADVSMKLTANASAYFGNNQAYEVYTGDFSEFGVVVEPDQGEEETPIVKQEMSFGTNVFAEKRVSAADGSLYYLLHWAVVNPTLSGTYISNSEMSELGVKINNEPFYNVNETPAWLTSTYTSIDKGNVFTIAIPASRIPNADIGVVITFPEHFKHFENDTYEFLGGSFYVTTEKFNSDTTVWMKPYTGDFSEFNTAE